MSELMEWPGGEWKTVRLIGKGGFGAVYEIQREEFGKVYKSAMKVMMIPPDDTEIESMMYEGMSMAEIAQYYTDHAKHLSEEFAHLSALKGNTNIVSYEDHMLLRNPDRVGWTILIRMELLTPVKQYFREHEYNEETIVRLGTDICRALKICHEKKIIHRDIKLDNIFVNEHGDFELGDFGIARITEKTMSSMTIAGTPVYMAPEVYRKERYGLNADVYSLGIAMYMLLNKMRGPFYPLDRRITPDDREKALIARTTGIPIPEPLYGSQKLKMVVMKAIAYSPQDRYRSAEEFYKALTGDEEKDPFEDAYMQAIQLERSARTCLGYEQAEASFQTLGAYKDCRERAARCHREAELLRRSEDGPPAVTIPIQLIEEKKKSRLPVILAGVVGALALATAGSLWLRPSHTESESTALPQNVETDPTSVPEEEPVSEDITTTEPTLAAAAENTIMQTQAPAEKPSRKTALKAVLKEAVNEYQAFDHVEWCEFDLDWDGSEELLVCCYDEHLHQTDYREYDIYRFDAEKMVYERLRDQHFTTEPWEDAVCYWDEKQYIVINSTYEEIQYSYFRFTDGKLQYLESVGTKRDDFLPLPFKKLEKEKDMEYAVETEMIGLTQEKKIQKCREWMAETTSRSSEDVETFTVRRFEVRSDAEDRLRTLLIPSGSLSGYPYPGVNDLDAEYYYHNGMLYFIQLSYAKYEYKFYMENRADGLFCIRFSGYEGEVDYPEGVSLEDTGTEYVKLCKYGIPFGRY